MIRRTMIALTAAAVLLLAAAPAHAAPSWRHRTCRYQGTSPRSWTRWEVRSTIRCAAAKWNVSAATALYIAERESGFYPRAVNPSSGACGLYQFYPCSSWGSHWRAYAHGRHVGRVGRSWTNARSVALAATHYAHVNGWGPWS